jgi:hypothetical protein
MNHSSDDSLTSCCWQRDSHKFFCGGSRGQFYYCDIDGNVMETWEGVRVQSLCSRKGSRNVLAADTLHRIREYNFEEISDTNM